MSTIGTKPVVSIIKLMVKLSRIEQIEVGNIELKVTHIEAKIEHIELEVRNIEFVVGHIGFGTMAPKLKHIRLVGRSFDIKLMALTAGTEPVIKYDYKLNLHHKKDFDSTAPKELLLSIVLRVRLAHISIVLVANIMKSRVKRMM
jgi:hypothetical protein